MSNQSNASPKQGGKLTSLRQKSVLQAKKFIDWTEVTPKEAKGYAIGAVITAIVGGTWFFASGAASSMYNASPLGSNSDAPITATIDPTIQSHLASLDQNLSQTDSAGSSPSAPGLELVDVGFIETESFPKIDIKLSNTGSSVAFVKRVEFHVERVWTLEWPSAGGAEEPSADYDLELATTGFPYIESVDVSQSVDANGVDRFLVTVIPDQRLSPFVDYIYQFQIVVVYDGDSKEIESKDIIFMIGYPGDYKELPESVSETPDPQPGYEAYVLPYYTIADIVREVASIEAIRNERLEILEDSLP